MTGTRKVTRRSTLEEPLPNELETVDRKARTLPVPVSARAAGGDGGAALLAAVAVAGKGRWITGTVMIVVCCAFSLLVVERLLRS